MSDTALRSLVERLLRGDFRVLDISTLFLAMRDRHGGRQTVREVGDFVAHHSDRFKGIVTDTTRDFFTVIRFQLPKTPTISLNDLPRNIVDILYATFRRIDNKILRSELGLKRSVAERLLQQIEKKIMPDNSGKLFLSWPTSQDVSLIRCLITRIISKSAFDDDRLFEEFSATLIANGLLQTRERKAFETLKTAITLFTIAKMHLCMVDLGDGTNAILEATSNTGSGTMGVSARAGIGTFNVAGFVFNTNLVAPDHCEPTLMAELKGNIWSCDLELTQAKKLAKLG